MDRADLVFECLRLVRAFYWIMVEVLEVLEGARSQAALGLKFHLDLASKRVRIILDHLKTAVEEAGLSLGERMSKEALCRTAGSISIETLQELRSTVKELTAGCKHLGRSQAPMLASRLLKFAGLMDIAAGILKSCVQNLRIASDKHAFKVRLALQATIRDLELMVQIHRQLASNPQMLAENLKAQA